MKLKLRGGGTVELDMEGLKLEKVRDVKFELERLKKKERERERGMRWISQSQLKPPSQILHFEFRVSTVYIQSWCKNRLFIDHNEENERELIIRRKVRIQQQRELKQQAKCNLTVNWNSSFNDFQLTFGLLKLQRFAHLIQKLPTSLQKMKKFLRKVKGTVYSDNIFKVCESTVTGSAFTARAPKAEVGHLECAVSLIALSN